MAKLEQYGHGGDLQTAGEIFGRSADQFIDFSANINPLGPPETVIKLLQEQTELVTRYPDPAQREFRLAVANKIGIDADMVIAGNGAAECMALSMLAFSPQKIGVVYPCFSEYTQLAKQFGASVEACFATDTAAFLPQFEEIEQLIDRSNLIFLGHPNNPTGTVYSMPMLEAIADKCEQCGCYLIIDEAFLDFLLPQQQVSLIHRLQDYAKIIIIRSMTKFYAIPGLRLGFAVSRKENIEQMRNKQVTWSVNQLALHAGVACLSESSYEDQTRQFIQEERDFMLSRLTQFSGWQVWPSQTNYLLLRAPESMQSVRIQQKLGEKGVLIRDCAMYPGLTERDIRIAIKSRSDNERLLDAMMEFIK